MNSNNNFNASAALNNTLRNAGNVQGMGPVANAGANKKNNANAGTNNKKNNANANVATNNKKNNVNQRMKNNAMNLRAIAKRIAMDAINKARNQMNANK